MQRIFKNKALSHPPGCLCSTKLFVIQYPFLVSMQLFYQRVTNTYLHVYVLTIILIVTVQCVDILLYGPSLKSVS